MDNYKSGDVTNVAVLMRRWLNEIKAQRRIKTDEKLVAVTLGSGFGNFGNNSPFPVRTYQEIGLPSCRVPGHDGVVRYMEIGQQGVIIFSGRLHLYEGHRLEDVVLGVRAAAKVGAMTQIITCASGAVKPDLKPGSLVRIEDHINMTGKNPLVGENDRDIGPRFPDMTEPYDPDLGRIAGLAAAQAGITLRKGVYAEVTGPNYETRAEIRMLKALGADLVGMSTVMEVLALRHLRVGPNHLRVKVLALTLVTNLAAGLSGRSLSHDEVVKVGEENAPKLQELLTTIIERLP